MRLEIAIDMSLKNLVNDTTPYLDPHESGELALERMDEYKISHLPVVKSQTHEYCGLLSEDEVYDMEDTNQKVGSANLKHYYVDENEHIFDVLSLASENKLSVVPVLDSNQKYLGVITQQTIIDKMSEATSASIKGGIIEIETDSQNYSPALIAGISENNSMKIMSLLTRSHGTRGINAILKLNGPDTSGVIQGLERHGYKVRQVYQGDTKYSDLMEERYNALMNYMNV